MSRYLSKYKLICSTFKCALAMLMVASTANADILVAKLDDIEIATTPGRATDLRVTERLCVASNPVGPYSLLVIGNGVDGSFTLQNGPHIIVYALQLRDRQSDGGFRDIMPNIPLDGLLSRPLRNNQTCPGNAARLRMTIRKEALSGALSGKYQGQIQLTVVPE